MIDELNKPGRVGVLPHIAQQRDQRSRERLVVQTRWTYLADAKLGREPEWIRKTPLIVVIDEAHRCLCNRDMVRSQYIIEQAEELYMRAVADNSD